MIIGANKMTVQMLSMTGKTLAHMQLYIELIFRKDESFEYAEKIENLIKQTNK